LDVEPGIYCESNTFNTYYYDNDDDELGGDLAVDYLCSDDAEEDWVLNSADLNDEIFCLSNIIDECDVCDGNNTQCIEDCAGVMGGDAEDLGCGCLEPGPSGCDNTCGSTLEDDECGVCGGDGQQAGYTCDGIPELFTFSQSTQQAFYYFYTVTINHDNVNSDDWVGAFKGDVCVGSLQWDITMCNNDVCSLPVMGNDGSDWTVGYMLPGDFPSFKIFNA
jgi:hypothetical protein